MNSSRPPPPMTHSASYYEHQRKSNNSSPAFSHPRQPSLRSPPAVYVGHTRNSPTGRYHGDNSHVKTSASSGTSASSAASDLMPYKPIHPYIMGSEAEQGYVEHSSRRSSHISPTRSHAPTGSNIGHSEMVEDHSAVVRYVQEHEINEDEQGEKDHALWILIWLSCLDPLHSLFSCFFTVFILIGLVVLTPVRLFRKESSFSTSLIRTVAPIFRHHLQMIHAESVKNAHTFDFNPSALILVHVASPLLSFGVAFFSWIAAVFWLFAIIMGNPDGTEKRDDGRATVLMIRNWWEKYLLNAIRP